MSTTGAQSPTSIQAGLAIETTSGIEESAPDVYSVLAAEVTPKNKKPTSSKRVSGNLDPVLPVRGGETTEFDFPMLPLLDGNGLGQLFLALMGADDCDQLGTTDAYEHTFAREDLIKTFTAWFFNGIQGQRVRMCAVDQYSLELTKEGEVKQTFGVKGADMKDASFGSPSYIDLDAQKPNQLVSLGARLEYGEPGAAIRSSWETLKLILKRNLVFGRNSRTAIPSGSGSPQMVVSGDFDCSLDLGFINTDDEELRRWRQGGNTNPSATQHQDNAGLVDGRLTIFGTTIDDADPWGEADTNNAGTLSITVGGSYSGSGLTIWEVQIKEGTPDQYRYRKSTDGTWGQWSSYSDITTGPDTLSDGVTLTFSSTTTGTEGDMFYVYSHRLRMLRFNLPSMVIDDFSPEAGRDFLKGILKLYHTSGPGAAKPSIDMVNLATTAYS